ncbi:glycosyltransferase [Mangrovimonas sp. TPBH4]|uniref:glycosyltransferase n=1 Tax=Mangrovimonas sp. TPBH4 TaxID=1645914 RepID=UPI0006B5264D|nr:glycosyltransferase [Mangrovimonas sp. TPBH4]
MQIEAPNKKEKRNLRLLIVIGVISILNFLYWFFKPDLVENKFLFVLLTCVILFDVFRIIYIWYHYWDLSVPEKPKLTKGFHVDVFTTFCPGEPIEMVEKTLLAICNMEVPHTTYLCDEEGNTRLKAFCQAHGIIHVTRDNRKDAKAGNINNALKQATGDICIILDPDHIPESNFIAETLPYFEDEEIGFVQTVQGYYNQDESLVAKGAAEQTYLFYGPLMMTMNSYGTVNAIGANCVFRREALDSIGGHATGLSEDMHTSMQLYAKGWKSVYLPKMLTKGLVPSSLEAYYKQQLKWARGTFELLVSVYPKLFSKFTWRQKLHFGILPLHYLTGFIYLFCMLIPIWALFFSTSPWKGNIYNFGFITLPVICSLIGIRMYVQKWLVKREERGVHFIAGLLMHSAWWVYILGTVYTLIRKKVPYIATPKSNSSKTNFRLVLPNLIFGALSIIAIIYGLQRDFTPFSIFMSCYALYNAFDMFYTLAFAYGGSVKRKAQDQSLISRFNSKIFSIWQKTAVPVMMLLVLASGFLLFQSERIKLRGFSATIQTEKEPYKMLGAFVPKKDTGFTELEEASQFSAELGSTLDIISFYVAWDKKETDISQSYLDSIYTQNAIPMITWEPWIHTFEKDSLQEKNVFQLINEGEFDSYISQFAVKLRELKHPVYLRFAHEFDNPFYPWYNDGEKAAEEYKRAWRHVYLKFMEAYASNVIWVWNPWKADNIKAFYPGDHYVDWVGVNVLNYDVDSISDESKSFKMMFDPFHMELEEVCDKPVMISEFGSLGSEENKRRWINSAFRCLRGEFDEIKAIVFFNSSLDDNHPEGYEANETFDWSIKGSKVAYKHFKPRNTLDVKLGTTGLNKLNLKHSNEENSNRDFMLNTSQGVNIKKGQNWKTDYHVLTRERLEEDFAEMKALGINTIKFMENDTYDYNLLNISSEYDLNVVYSFFIPEQIDFLKDSLATKNLKKHIIEKIQERKENSHVVSWAIENDILKYQKGVYGIEEQFFQNKAYLNWLDELISEINTVDPDRPLSVTVTVNNEGLRSLEKLEQELRSDFMIGLHVVNSDYYAPMTNYLAENDMDFLISDIEVKSLMRLKPKETSVCLSEWQDRFEVNRVTFDGLVDRMGGFKKEYFDYVSYTSLNANSQKAPTVKVLKPYKILTPGYDFTYSAMEYDDSLGWHVPDEGDHPSEFEWSLVKTNSKGDFLTINSVGSSQKVDIEMPRNYNDYRLLLTVKRGEILYNYLTRLDYKNE